MKICILLSSYDESGSSFQDFDSFQNPGIYVKSHLFEQRIIKKRNAKEEIDQIIKEDFDYIWNFLWGPADENIAGVEEIKYLESKNVPMIGTSSKFLSLSKLDYKEAITAANFKTANGIAINGDEESITNLDLGDLKFPLIIKPSVGCGSEHMTPDSVCHKESELVKQIRLLKSKIHVNYEILIEEFIEGEEIACMVLETENGVIALEPLIYIFPKDWPSTRKFLDFDLKFVGIERGQVTYKIFDEDPVMKEKIKETAIKAYQALAVLGSGYARVDFRLNGSDLYVLEINPCPAFFAELGNSYGDDFVIESTFPGSHEKLVNTIISSKRRFDNILSEYNQQATSYDKDLETVSPFLMEVYEKLIETFDYSGTVLDLGCGTGLLGNIILRQYNAKLTGIDISPEMLKLAHRYEKVYVGLLENVVFELKPKFNHIISSGALTFVDNQYFEKIFSQMFHLASNSISLIIDDITDDFKSMCEKNHAVKIFNHVAAIANIPPGWSLVHKQRTFLWKSLRIGTEVFGLVLRYENSNSIDATNNNVIVMNGNYL